MNNKSGAFILGTGSYLPEKVLTNKDMEEVVDTTDEWITSRTGIKERRIAGDTESASVMAVYAAREAIEDAGITPDDISMVITASVTGDYQFPSTACIIQDKLGIKNAGAFDISAACAGFIYALETGRQFVLTGGYNKVLIVGVDKMSSVTDWTDRNICVLLGDGAGACILGDSGKRGRVLSSLLLSDGMYADLLKVPAGGSVMPASSDTVKNNMHFMKMSGREVYKHSIRALAEVCRRILSENSLTIDDIDMIIPHQANIRIINTLADKLGCGSGKMYVNLDKYGNTSGASVPIALNEVFKKGLLEKGQRILLTAFGSGFAYGSCIMEI